MDIKYNEGLRLLKIDTKNTTYAMEINQSGIVTHNYWGAYIERDEDIPLKEEVQREISFHSFKREEASQEYMPWGGYYFDEVSLKAVFSDGVRDIRFRYDSHEITKENGSLKLSVIMSDIKYPLQIELIYKIYEGSDIIDKNCVIVNKGQDTITLEKAFSAMWRLPYQKQYRLTHLAGRWGGEYNIERLLVTQAKTVIETRMGMSGYDACPFYMIDDGKADEQSGNVWFGAVQWSGNWKIVVEKTRFGVLQATGGINDFDFSWPLKSGESFETPVFTGGISRNGFGGASRILHDYQKSQLMPDPMKEKILPIIYNSWGTFEFDVDEKRMISLAKLASEAGAELFVIDDGWFGTRNDASSGLGDWYPHKEKFPNGLNPLINAVNNLGMDFGIWVEPEMVNPDSDLYRAHPEWAFQYEGRESTLGRQQLVLNLAREDVCEYIFERMDWLLGDHNIKYLKFDNNRFITEPGWLSLPQDEQKTIWVRYVRNFYRFLDKLSSKYPSVIMENCASGGARTDLAMTKYTVRVNRSDNQDTLDVLKLHEGFTHFIKPQMAGGACHISKKATYGINKRTTPMKYQAHAGMMGWLAIGDNLFEYSNEEMEELKGYTEFYKKIRSVIYNADFYRLVSPRENPYAANLYVLPDKSEAILYVLGQSMQFQQVIPRIKIPGLDLQATYRVDGYRDLSGRALTEMGVPVDLKGDFDSHVIRIRMIK